jgi:hypothetical protein
MTSQEWWNDMRVLTQESDIRRLRPTDERVIRVVPRPRNPTWGDLTDDAATRTILAHLARLGFEQNGCHDGRAYLTLNVQPRPILAVVTVDEDDPATVTRVTCGRDTMTPADAVRWLETIR